MFFTVRSQSFLLLSFVLLGCGPSLESQKIDPSFPVFSESDLKPWVGHWQFSSERSSVSQVESPFFLGNDVKYTHLIEIDENGEAFNSITHAPLFEVRLSYQGGEAKWVLVMPELQKEAVIAELWIESEVRGESEKSQLKLSSLDWNLLLDPLSKEEAQEKVSAARTQFLQEWRSFVPIF